MSKASFSIRMYSFYLVLIGAGMILIPNILLGLLGFAGTNEIWIRMLGLFTVTTAIYYFYSSAHEQTAFFKSTVAGRLFFFLMTIAFVFAYHQSPMLIAIGSIDLLGSLWTLKALKQR
jgi:hypothetical protein